MTAISATEPLREVSAVRLHVPNIVGERVLGLPKEPNPDKPTPFRDLPKN